MRKINENQNSSGSRGCKNSIFFGVLLSIFLAGCTHQQNLDDIDTTNLSQLESVHVQPLTPSSSKTELSQLRIQSLQDSAMSIGAQGWLAFASEKINNQMYKDR